MKSLFLIFLTTLIFISVASNKKFSAPSFCGGLECPEFTIIRTLSEEIEIREYQDSNWVTIEMKGDKEISNKNSFWALFNYISGKNSQNEKINMSAPVVYKINSKIPFTTEEKWGSMSFFLGNKYQKDNSAPQPTEDGVFLTTQTSRKYAVISYNGYSNEKDEIQNLMKLGTYLSSQGIAFVNEYFFYAGYDAPYKFWSRHNEILVELI
jgi:hypothetical protein